MITHTIAATGHTFQHPSAAQARVEGTVAAQVFQIALDALNDLATKKATMLNDADLSPQGRERRLKPLYESAWSTLVAGYLRLAELQTVTDSREAQLLAVPKLDPTHSAVAIEDRECRDFYRSQSISDRTNIMNSLQNDPAAGVKFYRLQIALLRSPVPLPGDHETAFFAALWKQTKRLESPGEALAIDADRNASAYGVRGLGHVQGLMASITGWSRAQLISWLVLEPIRTGAAKALGYSVFDLAAAKQAQQAAGRIPTLA